jgi:hypothetical protein
MRGGCNKLASLLMKFISPENIGGALISDAEYAAGKSPLVSRKSELEKELTVENLGLEQWVELSERTFKFVRYARAWFKHGNTEVRRGIFTALGSDLTIKDKKVAITIHSVFKSFVDNAVAAQEEMQLVRTYEDGLKQGLKGTTVPVCPTVRRVRDSNPRGF